MHRNQFQLGVDTGRECWRVLRNGRAWCKRWEELRATGHMFVWQFLANVADGTRGPTRP